MNTPGETALCVRVTELDGAEWIGAVVEELIPDRAGYGITRVQVISPQASRHYVGQKVNVATKRLTYL